MSDDAFFIILFQFILKTYNFALCELRKFWFYYNFYENNEFDATKKYGKNYCLEYLNLFQIYESIILLWKCVYFMNVLLRRNTNQ